MIDGMTSAHFIFIPAVLIVGIVIGWILGGRAARDAFAIYDVDERVLTLRRIEYPVETAQRRIFNAGLPPSLAHRLAVGR